MSSDPSCAAHLDNLASCSRCGLCLDVCPTYRLQQNEAESPRGRIQLMWLHELGELSAENIRPHIDSCLRCGRCEPVCPTGVKVVVAVEQHLVREEIAIAPSLMPRGRVGARIRFLVNVMAQATKGLLKVPSSE
jgi:glycolate oxidase iron-sulfur subunit